MRFIADHAFHIGNQHLRNGMPCQDYAASEARSDSANAVVSDGCSSGGKTDIGARIVALNTLNALREGNAVTIPFDQYCFSLDEAVRQELNLKHEDMLATIGYIRANMQLAELRLLGDGVLAVQWGDTDVAMMRIEWANNMPAYRAYMLDDYAGLRNAMKDWMLPNEHVWYHGDGTQHVYSRSFDEGIKGTNWVYPISSTAAYPTNFAIFSDGVAQVTAMDWKDVVKELMSFKSYEGDFVKRRMNRFIRDIHTAGKGPMDDIAMACVHIEQ